MIGFECASKQNPYKAGNSIMIVDWFMNEKNITNEIFMMIELLSSGTQSIVVYQ